MAGRTVIEADKSGKSLYVRFLNTRMMQYVRDCWRSEQEADDPVPTWFGKVVFFLLKTVWTAIIIAWWLIVQYGILGCIALIGIVIFSAGILIYWMMFGRGLSNFKTIHLDAYEFWSNMANDKVAYWDGRDV